MKVLPREARAIDLAGFGEASIDEVWLLPEGYKLGDKGRAVGRDRLGGGQIATALVAAARLGARTSYLGPIGDDAIADEIRRGLVDERVHVAEGARVSGATSRTALVLVEANGERTVMEAGGAVARVDEALLTAVANARALHLDGTRPEAAVALARHARACDTVVSVDVDLFPASRAIEELLSLADVCVLPRGLAQQLTRAASAENALRALAERGPVGALVIETRGAEGSIALLGDRIEEVAPFSIEVVDTTACGDTFRAALLCALLEGDALPSALRFASAAAALKCRAVGRRGCPTRGEVEALLSAR